MSLFRDMRGARRAEWAVLVLSAIAFVAGLAMLHGCASIWSSVKSSTFPAGGAAGGAMLGSAAGPIGVPVGAAVGAVVGHGIDENAQLRSGELQGEGAGDKEVMRWKGLTPAQWETLAVKSEGSASFFKKWLTRAALAIGAWTAIKYGWPQSRAARNFWGGLRGLLLRERGAVRRIISATGIAHTEAKP